MPAYDFRSPRLFVTAPLAAGAAIVLDRAQGHYLTTVLRRKSGDRVLVFNGRDGEWSAELEGRKRDVALRLGAKVRDQTTPTDLHYLFAPLKSARLDYMVQKAVEMGAARLQPVLTRHGQVARVNLDRMRANAIEAAEQCGILSLPEIAEPVDLTRLLAGRDPARTIVFWTPKSPIRSPRCPPCLRVRRSRCWSDPKAALPKTSGRRCSGCRTWFVLHLARGFSVPIPRRWRRSRSFRRWWGIG
jgi:16S rRNA (uracil1498-N3)-methyltransferase